MLRQLTANSIRPNKSKSRPLEPRPEVLKQLQELRNLIIKEDFMGASEYLNNIDTEKYANFKEEVTIVLSFISKMQELENPPYHEEEKRKLFTF